MYKKELDKLKTSLGEVYDTSLFQTMNSFEKDREELLKASIDTFTSSTIQSAIKDMESVLGTPSMLDLFNNKDDYLNYTTPILDGMHNHNYEELQKALGVESYEKYIKDDISHTFKSLGIVDDTLQRINETSAIDLEKYTASFTKAFDDLTNNKNLLASSQSLLGMSEEINQDKFKYDMKREIPQYISSPKLPNIPNYGKKIIEAHGIQNSSLERIVSHMEIQNKISEEQGKVNKLASDEQIKALAEQVKQNKVSSEQQNKDTNKMIYISIFIAILGFGVAIWTNIVSTNKANEIYEKENISSNQQHKELLNRLDGLKSGETSKEQIKILKAMLATMERNSQTKGKK
jgi:hypothetical protein